MSKRLAGKKGALDQPATSSNGTSTPTTAATAAYTSVSTSQPLRVYFAHPDLGIGGAERLIVDAAVGLQSRHAHHVTIFTSHHDRSHCFEETKDQLDVVVHGDFLPQAILGGAKVLCAILRSLYLALAVIALHPPPDVLIVDQLSIALPLYKLWWGATVPILFYCHYPDLKLASGRQSILKRLYRVPFDWLEEWSMGWADSVMVNSNYTRQVYADTFKRLAQSQPPPVVVYPSINFANYDSAAVDSSHDSSAQPINSLPRSRALYLSINRFERKKNVALAIQAFARLRSQPTPTTSPFTSSTLVLAGGYDPINAENRAYVPELEEECARLGLEYSRYPDVSGDVVFLLSFNAAQRTALLARCCCVVYTPENEHFGIVPVEAMYARRAVIACDSGGPVESVEDGRTGWLCRPAAESFAAAMQRVLAMDEAERAAMGERGRQRMVEKFSIGQFVDAFDRCLRQLSEGAAGTKSRPQWTSLLSAIAILMMIAGVGLMLTDR